MKLPVFLVLCAAVCSLAPASLAQTDPCREDEAQGKHAESIIECTRQIKGETPTVNIAGSYYYRANAYVGTQHYAEAIADYNKVIELMPSVQRAYVMRGRAYESEKQYDLAMADFQKAITLKPDDYYAYDNRGDMYEQQGKLDEAIADYSRSMELNPKYTDAVWDRGKAYEFKGDFARAIADFDQATDSSPDFEYPYLHQLICIWLARASDKDALEKLRRHIASSPSTDLIRAISRFYVAADGVSEQSVMDEARKGKDAEEVNYDLAETYFYLGAKRLVAKNRSGAIDFLNRSAESGVNSLFPMAAKAMLAQIKAGSI